jgi:uncharacterized protein
MTNHIKIITYCFFIVLLSCKTNSQEQKNDALKPLIDLSKFERYRESKELGLIVSDYDSVFKKEERLELGSLIEEFNIKTTRQIVVVTIDSLNPYSDIQKFATDLGNYWGVGAREKNNGLTIVLCRPERKIGIATGYGTEKILTDSICKNVIDSTMIPRFLDGDFYGGIKSGVIDLMQKWGQ